MMKRKLKQKTWKRQLESIVLVYDFIESQEWSVKY